MTSHDCLVLPTTHRKRLSWISWRRSDGKGATESIKTMAASPVVLRQNFARLMIARASCWKQGEAESGKDER